VMGDVMMRIPTGWIVAVVMIAFATLALAQPAC